ALALLAGLLLAVVQAPKAQALDNGLARTPPMGWANWPSLGCNYTAATLEAEARQLVSSGLAADGYRLFRIQECIFEPTRDAAGNLVPRPERFPNGLKPVVDYLHSLGLKVGIYTDAGTFTCAGPVNGSAGSYGHDQQDADYFASLGADEVEEDWCNVPFQDFPGQSHEQVAKTLLTRMRDAIANSGRPILFYAFAGWDPSTNIWQWGSTVLNAWRTGPDLLGPGGPISWANIVRNFELNAAHPDQSGPGGFGDPDMMAVGLPGINDGEGQAMFSLWAVESAPLSIGTDLTNSNQFTGATAATYGNPEVIAIDQDALGRQARLVSDDGTGHQVWSKSLANGDRAVLMLNSGDTPLKIDTTARAAGLPAAGAYAVRDLWAHTTAESAGTLAAWVPPHSVMLYRVSPLHDEVNQYPPVTDVSVNPQVPPVSPGSQIHVAKPGETITVPATFRNDGREAVTDASLSVTAPDGWTVSGAAAAGAVPTGKQLAGSLQVTIPPDAANGIYTITGNANYRWSDGTKAGSSSAQASIPVEGIIATATERELDTTTQGTWKGVYGSQGYDIVGDSQSLPSYVHVSTDGTEFTWDNTPTDTRALQRATSSGRIAATLFGDTVHLNISVEDQTPHRISLYLLDWDGGTPSGQGVRQESVTVSDSISGTQLDAVDSGNFTDGEYLSWNVTGDATFTFHVEAGANAVVSGIFIDPAS
ncbi:MAG: hypothetical protein J2P16_10065, partial [Mycobacterium sp.]|nr:hypothetical protein [Mycobacterium sp.]